MHIGQLQSVLAGCIAILVRCATANYLYSMTRLDKYPCDIGKELAGGSWIGSEKLVDEEKSHVFW
jgi:hypothetical protein